MGKRKVVHQEIKKTKKNSTKNESLPRLDSETDKENIENFSLTVPRTRHLRVAKDRAVALQIKSRESDENDVDSSPASKSSEYSNGNDKESTISVKMTQSSQSSTDNDNVKKSANPKKKKSIKASSDKKPLDLKQGKTKMAKKKESRKKEKGSSETAVIEQMNKFWDQVDKESLEIVDTM